MGRGGDRIKAIRDQLRISQGALAKLLKASEKSVGRWERGDTEPKYELVAAAEKLLPRPSAAAEREPSSRARKKRA